MLAQIFIQNLATIETLHLHLPSQTSMITGETGAGKSVFIEAIELALGGRIKSSLIRPGKEKAEISLSFEIKKFPKVMALLKSMDLEQESDCIIRRIITQDGRSRCYVNGIPSPLQLVKDLGELLFHLHSQHAQQILLKSETQRELLDRYGDHLGIAQQVKKHFERRQQIQHKISELQDKNASRQQLMEYLQFQAQELDALGLKPGEWELLSAEHNQLTHFTEIHQAVHAVLQGLTHDGNAALLPQLSELQKLLQSIIRFEPQVNSWHNTLANIAIQLQDLESELQHFIAKNDSDPDKLLQVEERVRRIFALSRKHKIAPEALHQVQEKLLQELAELQHANERLAQLQLQLKDLEQHYQADAQILTQKRQTAAQELSEEVTKTIRSLSLPHGEFKIDLAEENSDLHYYGHEKIVFLIKTNPDQMFQPIAKCISGGELSRLSLALHLALAERTSIPTLIFDEVDAGLSGATAEKIGKLLRKLGETYQVFCITHQAQVAACGHHHLLVKKAVEQQTTRTHLAPLSDQEKTAEIARLLAGEKITAKTLEHAKEVLQLV